MSQFTSCIPIVALCNGQHSLPSESGRPVTKSIALCDHEWLGTGRGRSSPTGHWWDEGAGGHEGLGVMGHWWLPGVLFDEGQQDGMKVWRSCVLCRRPSFDFVVSVPSKFILEKNKRGICDLQTERDFKKQAIQGSRLLDGTSHRPNVGKIFGACYGWATPNLVQQYNSTVSTLASWVYCPTELPRRPWAWLV